MKSTEKTYHIIGGGVAGLTCAKNIKSKNQHSKVIIYEAAKHFGGRCYSFYDKYLEREIDNATHCIVGANSNIAHLIQNKKWHKKIGFYDIEKQDLSTKISRFKNHILLSIFNTKTEEICKKLIRNVVWKLFPFLSFNTKLYYSQNSLSQDLIEPLTKFADEIHLNHILKSFENNQGRITKLIFNKKEIIIKDNDIVISAMDAYNYGKIFGGNKFEYNEIINIFYRTSQAITLPQKQSFLGVIKGQIDWIFVNKDILSVTISAANNIKIKDDELARQAWIEVRGISGRKAAFVPPYRVIRNKKATIKHDEKNQALRPQNNKTAYSNLFVVGDWTYNQLPCCLEAAVLSAKKFS